jgi:hypothetical protein
MSRGGSSLFQRGQLHRFFAFQRGKNPQKQRSSTMGGRGVWFLNVIAQSKLMYLPGKKLLNCDL